MKETKELPSKNRWCPDHEQHHVVGSGMYIRCFGESVGTTKPLQEDKASPKEDKATTKADKTPPKEEKASPKEDKATPLTFSSEIYISGFSQESVLKCMLKESAPDVVTVKAPFYADGGRTFYREQQPFKVTPSEFSSVLDRGEKLFKLIK